MDSLTALAPNDFPPRFWSSPLGIPSESLPQRTSAERLSISHARRRWCLFAWVFIGLVSAYDAWLVKAYEQVIFDVEKNPLARYILVSCDSVEPFLCCKAAGALLVLTILALMYRHTPRLAWPVIQSVAAFQLLLLVFLHVA